MNFLMIHLKSISLMSAFFRTSLHVIDIHPALYKKADAPHQEYLLL